MSLPTLPNGLTAKQEAFAQAVANGSSYSDAYKASYNVAPNSAPNTIHQDACLLAAHPNVAPRIAQLRQIALDAQGVTPNRVIAELAKIGFSDMSHFASWGPAGVTLKASDELAPGAAGVVAEISESISDKGSRNTRFKLHSKVYALLALAKITGALSDKPMDSEAKITRVTFVFNSGTQDSDTESQVREASYQLLADGQGEALPLTQRLEAGNEKAASPHRLDEALS